MNPPCRRAESFRAVARGALPETSPATRLNRFVAHCAIVCILALLLPCCADPYENLANLDSTGTTIVCFGDSITAGYGVAPEQAFPRLIAERLGMTVVNAGQDGDTAADGLARLEKDVLPHDPRMVLVEFGGNDFRHKVDKTETLKNIERMVQRITDRGAMVVIMEIRIGFLRGRYLEGCRRIADTNRALLIPDFMSGILGSDKLTVDGIHPNAEGHELIAQRVIEKLVPLLKEADRKRSATQ